MEEFLNYKLKYIKPMIIIGVCFIILNFLLPIFNIKISQFASSMLSIWGLILIVMGVAKYCMFKNESIAKYYKINENDERNTIIRGRASYLTFVFSTLALAFLTILFIALDYKIVYMLTAGLLAVQYVLFFVLIKYYGKKY